MGRGGRSGTAEPRRRWLTAAIPTGAGKVGRAGARRRRASERRLMCDCILSIFHVRPVRGPPRAVPWPPRGAKRPSHSRAGCATASLRRPALSDTLHTASGAGPGSTGRSTEWWPWTARHAAGSFPLPTASSATARMRAASTAGGAASASTSAHTRPTRKGAPQGRRTRGRGPRPAGPEKGRRARRHSSGNGAALPFPRRGAPSAPCASAPSRGSSRRRPS